MGVAIVVVVLEGSSRTSRVEDILCGSQRRRHVTRTCFHVIHHSTMYNHVMRSPEGVCQAPVM